MNPNQPQDDDAKDDDAFGAEDARRGRWWEKRRVCGEQGGGQGTGDFFLFSFKLYFSFFCWKKLVLSIIFFVLGNKFLSFYIVFNWLGKNEATSNQRERERENQLLPETERWTEGCQGQVQGEGWWPEGLKHIIFLLQYKIAESPVPSEEEEESSEDEDDGFGPKKKVVDDDPVARK